MPSFGQLMIDDYLRASQNLQQVQHQATVTAANIDQNQTQGMQQAIQGNTQALEQSSQQQQQDQQAQQQSQDRYQQLLIHHEQMMSKQKDEEKKQIAASARLWGRAQAEQSKPWDTTKVNPAWPDDIKEQALLGYEEGKGKVAMAQTKSDITEGRQNRMEDTRQRNRYNLASYKSGQSVTADLAKWKQKGGDIRLQLAPLFLEMMSARNMRRSEARDTIAGILQKAGANEAQINQRLSQLDHEVPENGQQPTQQPQSNDQLDEFGFPKFK